MLSAIQCSLRSLEVLLRGLLPFLSSDLRVDDADLLGSICDILAALELLSCAFESLLSSDVLVGDHELLRTILLRLRCLERLSRSRQVGLLCPIQLVLTSSE